jgi:hypothetical protein
MSNRPRRHDEILGASVVLTAWSADRRAEMSEALELLSPDPVDLDEIGLPYLAVERTSVQKAERIRDLLTQAGGTVELRDEWVTRDEPRPVAARPPCPFCGSTATQPYQHAGPGARKRMTCTTCGRVFRLGTAR